MGRTEPSQGLQPAAKRKEIRAKHAKTTVNKTIPALLTSNPRAKKGVEAAELISNPPAAMSAISGKKRNTVEAASAGGPEAEPDSLPARSLSLAPFIVRMIVTDTLTAAHHLHTTSPHSRNIALLNMASPLRPGGGVLTGANSQEETLCTHTTLLPSLREEFYRLPEYGGIYTPDVLVFRESVSGGRDLVKRERWFVDVVSAGMLRFPDLDESGEEWAGEGDEKCVEGKMVAVMRILAAKGAERVVLGAWGCGAYGNPVGAIARAWKRVLLGDSEGMKKGGRIEEWTGLKEVVFAIKEARMAERFAKVFGGLDVERIDGSSDRDDDNGQGNASDGEENDRSGIEELEAKVAEMEEQMSRVLNPDLKERLGDVLLRLKAELENKNG